MNFNKLFFSTFNFSFLLISILLICCLLLSSCADQGSDNLDFNNLDQGKFDPESFELPSKKSADSVDILVESLSEKGEKILEVDSSNVKKSYQPAKPVSQKNKKAISINIFNYTFIPDMISVDKGDYVVMTVSALDRSYGFALEAFDIDEFVSKDGFVRFEFVVDKSGSFEFDNPVFCATGCQDMVGLLIVD
ncbi:hypothetical protein HOK51_03570 [Candidatus Woesearchaeota archaeon]|jgi:hypothetical protein|nr:hypothetical protein [Candidatus Woesearchaeota archaeon]MBT6518900.1 hypothetical protein [Candidatus Woesearchaeota archaeon]MBT7368502.1 hypothetical protein [Candidatus Woesearchaeota archaeon]